MGSVKYFIFCMMIVASSSYAITFPMEQEIERHRQADAYIQKTFCTPKMAFTQGKIEGKNPSAVLKKSYLNYSCDGVDNNKLYARYVKGFYYGRMFI
jgi:hypothetical protein